MTVVQIEVYQEKLANAMAQCSEYIIETDPYNFDGAKNVLTTVRRDFLTSQATAGLFVYNTELNRQIADLKAHYMPWFMDKYAVDDILTPSRFTMPPLGLSLFDAERYGVIDQNSVNGLAAFGTNMSKCISVLSRPDLH
jgi:hypothetical protein